MAVLTSQSRLIQIPHLNRYKKYGKAFLFLLFQTLFQNFSKFLLYLGRYTLNDI
jgi:hypothetical protein